MLNLQAICQKLPPEGHVLLWIVFFLWEYGLGKTTYGSSVGLFITKPITALLKKLNGGQDVH